MGGLALLGWLLERDDVNKVVSGYAADDRLFLEGDLQSIEEDSRILG